jgi:hypothetical protein
MLFLLGTNNITYFLVYSDGLDLKLVSRVVL